MKKLLSLCIVLVILILALGIQNADAATAMYTVHFNPNGGEVTNRKAISSRNSFI